MSAGRWIGLFALRSGAARDPDAGQEGGFESFKVDVAPKSISIEIVSGLAQLIRKTLEAGSSPFRYIAPSTQTLRDVSNAQERFLNELGQTWTTD